MGLPALVMKNFSDNSADSPSDFATGAVGASEKKKLTRREFVGSGAALGAAVALGGPMPWHGRGNKTVFNVPGTIANDQSVDVTADLAAWIAGIADGSPGNEKILKFNGGTYRIDTMLALANRSFLTFDLGGNTTFKWNTANNDARRLLQFTTCQGIQIKNGTLSGTYTYPASGDAHNPTYQHMHAIEALGSQVYVSGMTIADFLGDGVYYGLSGTTRSTGDVIGGDIRRVGRNAISWVAAYNSKASGVFTQQCGYWNMDVEPNVGGGACDDIIIDGCSYGSQVGTTQRRVFGIVGWMPCNNIQWINNHVVSDRWPDIEINPGGPRPYRVKGVKLTGNDSVTNAPFNGIWEFYQVDTLDVSGNTIPTDGTYVLYLNDCCDVSVAGMTYNEAVACQSGATFR